MAPEYQTAYEENKSVLESSKGRRPKEGSEVSHAEHTLV